MNKNNKKAIEGLIFLSGSNGITMGELISILSIDQMSIENEITSLNEEYYRNEHAFKIIETAQTYKLVTTSDNAEIYQKYAELEFNDHLSNSALETLTIIAYNQAITRFEIEEKRGVMASHNLKILMTRDLIKVVGKSNEIGKPNLYGTTPEFLDFLGINAVEELPALENFVFDDEGAEQTDLFNDVEDFKEIKKRLLSNDNLISIKEEVDFGDIEGVEIKELDLGLNEETEEENIESTEE